jgi:hypothetical protein
MSEKTSRLEVWVRPENKHFLESLKQEFKDKYGKSTSMGDIIDEMLTEMRQKADADEISSRKKLF